MLRSQIDRG